jgi:hypothetical protein
VVFCCAVGVRSSALASRIGDQFKEHRIANMAGGVFRWANEGRPLCDERAAITTSVHPFNRHWEQFLTERVDANPN